MRHTIRTRLGLSVAVLGLVAGILVSPAAAPPMDPLVGYWPFDDGGTALVGPDATLAGGAGAYTNIGAGLNTQRVAHDTKSLDLQVPGSYASVGHTDALDVAAYTVSAWVNLGDRSTYRPIAVRGDSTVDDIELYFWPTTTNSGELVVAHNRAADLSQFDYVLFPNTPATSWFHLAVTFDGTTVRAFYDGVEQTPTGGTAATMVAPLDHDRGWLFGAATYPDFAGATVNGLLDEVRIYNAALSVGQVQALGDYRLFDVAMHQWDQLNPIGTSHAVKASLVPVLSFIPVDFAVTGVNPETAVRMTNAAGWAMFSYVGDVAGEDTITGSIAVAGGDAAQLTKHWFDQYVTVSGNFKPDGTKQPSHTFEGWFVNAGGELFGTMTVNFKVTKTVCTYAPLSGWTLTDGNEAAFNVSRTCTNGATGTDQVRFVDGDLPAVAPTGGVRIDGNSDGNTTTAYDFGPNGGYLALTHGSVQVVDLAP